MSRAIWGAQKVYNGQFCKPQQYLNNSRVFLYPPICFGLSLNLHCFLPDNLTMHHHFRASLEQQQKHNLTLKTKTAVPEKGSSIFFQKGCAFWKVRTILGGLMRQSSSETKARLPHRKWYPLASEKSGFNTKIPQQSLKIITKKKLRGHLCPAHSYIILSG